MNKYIMIDDKAYALDLIALNSYLFEKKAPPKQVDITENFDGDNKLMQKVIVETKVTGEDGAGAEENIKYDCLKFMLTVLFAQGSLETTLSDIDFATALALNTLIKAKILIEIE